MVSSKWIVTTEAMYVYSKFAFSLLFQIFFLQFLSPFSIIQIFFCARIMPQYWNCTHYGRMIWKTILIQAKIIFVKGKRWELESRRYRTCKQALAKYLHHIVLKALILVFINICLFIFRLCWGKETFKFFALFSCLVNRHVTLYLV